MTRCNIALDFLQSINTFAKIHMLLIHKNKIDVKNLKTYSARPRTRRLNNN